MEIKNILFQIKFGEHGYIMMKMYYSSIKTIHSFQELLLIIFITGFFQLKIAFLLKVLILMVDFVIIAVSCIAIIGQE